MNKSNNGASGWDRNLWAVEMHAGQEKPMLIGDTWNSIRVCLYLGEPIRCLLFYTRKKARAWCVAATKEAAKHSKDWRFKPVRVRETVKKLSP